MFIYLILAVLGLHCMGISRVVMSGGYFLVAVHNPLIAVDFLAAEHRFSGAQASILASTWAQ